jgi:hypothetical protein
MTSEDARPTGTGLIGFHEAFLRRDTEGRRLFDGVTAFLEVISQNDGSVLVDLLSLNGAKETEFEAGTYLVRATMPSGELLTGTMLVEAARRTTFSFAPPRFWVSDAAFTIGASWPGGAPRSNSRDAARSASRSALSPWPYSALVMRTVKQGAFVALPGGLAAFLPRTGIRRPELLKRGDRIRVQIADFDEEGVPKFVGGPQSAAVEPLSFTLLDAGFQEIEQSRLLEFGAGEFLHEPVPELVGRRIMWQCVVDFTSLARRFEMGKCWLRVETPSGTAQYVALPFARTVRVCAAAIGGTDDSQPTLDVRVTTDAGAADSMLGFLTSGLFQALELWRSYIANLFREAEGAVAESTYRGSREPLNQIDLAGAIVGSYCSLKMGAAQQWIHAIQELSEAFPAVPDFAIVLGWLQAQSNEMRGAVESWIRAAEAGSPYYTIGSRLLADGIDAVAETDRRRLTYLREIVRRRAALFDPASPYPTGSSVIIDLEFALLEVLA